MLIPKNFPEAGNHARLWMDMAICILSEREAKHESSQQKGKTS
jgi:hypothetical protein